MLPDTVHRCFETVSQGQGYGLSDIHPRQKVEKGGNTGSAWLTGVRAMGASGRDNLVGGLMAEETTV